MVSKTYHVVDIDDSHVNVGSIIIPWYEKMSMVVGFKGYNGPYKTIIDRIIILAPYPDTHTGFNAKCMSLEKNRTLRKVVFEN